MLYEVITDKLSSDEALGEIGHLIIRVVARAFGEILQSYNFV